MKHLVVMAALAAAVGTAPAQEPALMSRGALLYENHCGACHGEQMHWRDRRVARNFDGLRALVRRWQGTAQLRWSDEEVDDVAHYLNARFYRYEEPRM